MTSSQNYMALSFTGSAFFCLNPNLVVYCSPAEGGGTIRKNSHFVSSAIHIKIGSFFLHARKMR